MLWACEGDCEGAGAGFFSVAAGVHAVNSIASRAVKSGKGFMTNLSGKIKLSHVGHCRIFGGDFAPFFAY
jgi:hypothetical protein